MPLLPTSGGGHHPNVTEVEKRLITQLIGRRSFVRLLELGTGEGRLTSVFRPLTNTFVGVDIEPSAVVRARSRAREDDGTSFVVADASTLPFKNGVFKAVAMIRVYHRFSDPAVPLAEAFRVLDHSGVLLLSFNPRPSLKTLYDDVWIRLSTGQGFRSVSFSKLVDTEVPWGNPRGFVTSRKRTEERLQEAGFEVVDRNFAGLEELPIARGLPIGFLTKIGQLRAAAPGFPTVLILARKP